jgi:hypothetical protein
MSIFKSCLTVIYKVITIDVFWHFKNDFILLTPHYWYNHYLLGLFYILLISKRERENSIYSTIILLGLHFRVTQKTNSHYLMVSYCVQGSVLSSHFVTEGKMLLQSIEGLKTCNTRSSRIFQNCMEQSLMLMVIIFKLIFLNYFF